MGTFYKVVQMEQRAKYAFVAFYSKKKFSSLCKGEMIKETCLNRDPMIIVEKKISTSYDLDVYTSSYYMIVMYSNRM